MTDLEQIRSESQLQRPALERSEGNTEAILQLEFLGYKAEK